ncbi:MAG: hypothetical protein JWQ10_3814 [Herbaspirillum sp.]|nr:hypothetical protein [Herbaspirillum sp.]
MPTPTDQAQNPMAEALAQLLTFGTREEIQDAAHKFAASERPQEMKACYKKLSETDKGDLNARFVYSQLVEDGSHKTRAESRDLMLAILDDFPQILELNTEGNCLLIRYTAERCRDLGPQQKAIDLSRKLAPLSGIAGDYFLLSEILSQINNLEESMIALQKAMSLDPAFDTETNRDTLKIWQAGLEKPAVEHAAQKRKKIGRYPQTKDFLGDLTPLIMDHIAVDLKSQPKFINKATRFFTMGSCFARNISASLNKGGYSSTHMEISEYINTTFANRAFVDWLDADADTDNAVNERIKELLPAQWNPQNTLEKMRDTDVFILTLGVAPAFFDRATGEFVLPRPTALNSRVLAEKYEYRTTTVQENVDNVLYLINFIRKLSPTVKIVITVSPVPLLASFEFESCVAADCLSKSTMRLTAHEVVNNSKLENIIYWPSFEIFRWGGSNASNFYAADDGAAWHVSEEKVNQTIDAFIDIFHD